MIMTLDPTQSPLRTRPTLLFRLRDWNDEASWTEFYRLYYAFVFDFARRSGLQHADAEEVTQDVFKRVAETVHDFESDPNRGTFRGWLLNLTRWRIADKFRRTLPHERQPHRGPDADASDRTSTIERIPSEGVEGGANVTWENEWQRHVLAAALARLARRVPARHFQAFELYTRQGWPVLRVARELGISIATVYVISHRFTKQLKAEIALLREQLQ